MILWISSVQPIKAQKAASEMDAEARNIDVPLGKSLVYIMRPSSSGFAIKMTVECDYKYIGSIKAKRFIYTILDPGKHKFLSRSENDFELELTLEAGKTYYIKQLVKLGVVVARTKLQIVDEIEGKSILSKCKLSKDNLPIVSDINERDTHKKVTLVFYRRGKKQYEIPMTVSINDSVLITMVPNSVIEYEVEMSSKPINICYNDEFQTCTEVWINATNTKYIECSIYSSDKSPEISEVKVEVGEFYSKQVKHRQEKRENKVSK